MFAAESKNGKPADPSTCLKRREQEPTKAIKAYVAADVKATPKTLNRERRVRGPRAE